MATVEDRSNSGWRNALTNAYNNMTSRFNSLTDYSDPLLQIAMQTAVDAMCEVDRQALRIQCEKEIAKSQANIDSNREMLRQLGLLDDER